MTDPGAIDEFRCRMCGNCCRGEGYVRITPAEAASIASHLGMTTDEFVVRFAQRPEIHEHAEAGDWWLVDKAAPNPECVFLEGDRCRIDAVKPQHCRDFPMRWRTRNAQEYCEGMKSP
jgi:uncharacterized protein